MDQLNYPLGSYSISNPPSNATLVADLNTIQNAIDADEAVLATALQPSVIDTDGTLAANSDSKISSQKAIVTFLRAMYPIGTIYTNKTVPTNPATLFGFGTWAAITGEVIVGKAAAGTFSTAGALVGAETVTLSAAESGVPAHNHGNTGDEHRQHTHVLTGTAFNVAAGVNGTAVSIGGSANAQVSAVQNQSHYHATSNNAATAATNAHNNIQPSRVCYVWERTA
jgi:microcystin-dependent protein